MDDDVTTRLRLDGTSSAPLWMQLFRAIEQSIVEGVFAPGDRLPTERELSASLGLSRTSVRTALERLERSGLVSRRQGSGAYVEQLPTPWAWTMPAAASIFDPDDRQGASPLTSLVVRAGIEPLPPMVAAAFGGRASVGTVIERVRSVGRLPALHVLNYLPQHLHGVVPELRDPHASLYGTLRSVAGVRIARVHRTIEGALADKHVSRLLELEEGHPVVVVELVAYDTAEQVVDVSRATVRTDRLRITVDSGHIDLTGVSTPHQVRLGATEGTHE